MKQYYETHITLLGIPSVVRPFVEATGWKFSAIDGDPVLGEGVKCYATMFFSTKRSVDSVVNEVLEVAATLKLQDQTVLRRKVELVVFDDRSNKVAPCDGACPECHLDDIGAL